MELIMAETDELTVEEIEDFFNRVDKITNPTMGNIKTVTVHTANGMVSITIKPEEEK